jgi:hypothetical protein
MGKKEGNFIHGIIAYSIILPIEGFNISLSRARW